MEQLADAEDSVAFLEEALGSAVSRALLEVSAKRLKHPQLSVKESALKMAALFLKANNPGSTAFERAKYGQRLRDFIGRCELPVNLLRQARKRKSKVLVL